MLLTPSEIDSECVVASSRRPRVTRSLEDDCHDTSKVVPNQNVTAVKAALLGDVAISVESVSAPDAHGPRKPSLCDSAHASCMVTILKVRLNKQFYQTGCDSFYATDEPLKEWRELCDGSWNQPVNSLTDLLQPGFRFLRWPWQAVFSTVCVSACLRSVDPQGPGGAVLCTAAPVPVVQHCPQALWPGRAVCESAGRTAPLSASGLRCFCGLQGAEQPVEKLVNRLVLFP